jgi:hypothetical protein
VTNIMNFTIKVILLSITNFFEPQPSQLINLLMNY